MGFAVRLCHIVALTTAVLAASCTPAAAPEPKKYELEGQILAIRSETREVVIKHGDIVGFMPGMTMPFKVKDPAVLEGKAAGDLVKATLMVADLDAWIASIEKTGSAPLPSGDASVPTAANVDLLDPGDLVPNDVLTGDDGKPFTLEEWRGKAVALTFIYTRCPLPQFCPLMDRRFAEVQRIVAGDAALKGKVRLLSVSFDPDADTPEVLRAHAKKLGADPAVWTFATAPRETVDRFAVRFGVNVIREADKSITHNLATATIGADGRILNLYMGSDWTARQIADDFLRDVGGTSR